MTIKLLNVGRMQRRIDKLLSVFTKVFEELDSAVSKLNDKINENNEAIEQAKGDNKIYESKIKEYNTLKSKMEHIVK